jgi:arsenite methyltransferase
MLRTVSSDSTSLAEPAVLPIAQVSAAQPLLAVPSDDLNDNFADSLFEQVAWLYIFCREKLFRDDTQRMIAALWPNGKPAKGEKIIALGCGPGFCSCGLAERFREISVLGVDRSPSQLRWAREKRNELGLNNCRFQSDNVFELPHENETIYVLIASGLRSRFS